MSIKQYIETLPLKKIIKYDPHINLEKECISFIGAPRKHPYDAEKLIIIVDPFTSHTLFYEFKLDDITHVEEGTGLGTESGENLFLARIWVKRGALGLRYEPFEVDEPLKYLKDSELLHQTLSEMDRQA